MTWIQTRDGRVFDLESPSPDSIDPHTLGIVLSRMCRFGGHSGPFYSVAQHSVFVCDLVGPVGLKLPALLHDAHEAYWGFGDILRPAKHLFGFNFANDLSGHQANIDSAIAERFDIPFVSVFQNEHIKKADNVALATEARDVMESPPQPWEQLPEPFIDRIEPWDIDESYRRFSARLFELWGE